MICLLSLEYNIINKKIIEHERQKVQDSPSGRGKDQQGF